MHLFIMLKFNIYISHTISTIYYLNTRHNNEKCNNLREYKEKPCVIIKNLIEVPKYKPKRKQNCKYL